MRHPIEERSGGPIPLSFRDRHGGNGDESVVVAIDCGYGSVKTGSSQNGKIIAFPAGACPVEQGIGDLAAEKVSTAPLLVNGTPWVAGFESAKLPGYERPIHRSYATTDHYRALLLEALHRVGEGNIALLVLGLPTDLHLNADDQVSYLKGFAGQHDVRGRSVTIGEVVVCNQPLGSTVAFARRRGRIAVIDIGYRTTDTTLLIDGGVDPSGHATCQTACRELCDMVAASFSGKTGVDVSADMIDQQLRAGLMTIERRLKIHDLEPYLVEAAPGIAQIIWSSVQTTLRRSLALVDQVLLTGGGACLFRSAITELAAPIPITVPPDPATANVEGFLQLGISRTMKRRRLRDG